MNVRKPVFDMCICLGVLVFLAGFAAQIGSVPKSSRGYPFFLLCASAVLTIMLLFKAERKRRDERATESETADIRLFFLIVFYCIIVGLYIFLLNVLGYLISTFLFILGSLFFLHIRSWKLLVVLPVVLTLSMYALFTNFLMVTLPRGSWFSLFF